MNIQSNASIIRPGFPPKLISGLLKTTPEGVSFEAVDPTQSQVFSFAEIKKVGFQDTQILISKKGVLKRTVFVLTNPTPGVQILSPVQSMKELREPSATSIGDQYRQLISDWREYFASGNIKSVGIGKPLLLALFFLVACLGWLFNPFVSFVAIALFILVAIKL